MLVDMATGESLRATSEQPGAGRSVLVYNRLRRAIVQGELRPNQRLIEAALATSLDVSRTPIREALQRLALDGLVKRHRRGWVVREHNADEIRHIYDCRAALEGYAARLAALSATDAQLAELESILGDTRDSSSREDMVAVNERFHEAIIEDAGNPLLAELTHRSRLYYFNRRVAQLYTDAEAAHSRTQHVRLLKALQERDADEAETVAREHVETALQAILSRPQLLASEGDLLAEPTP